MKKIGFGMDCATRLNIEEAAVSHRIGPFDLSEYDISKPNYRVNEAHQRGSAAAQIWGCACKGQG